MRDFVLDRIRRYGYFYNRDGFTLKSGAVSNELFDLSRCLRFSEGLYALGCMISPFFESNTKAVLGMGAGGDMLAAAAVTSSNYPNVGWATIREQPKGRGADLGCITGPVEKYDQVVVVEDVLTTGESLIEALRRCFDAELVVQKVVVLLDREEFNGYNRVKQFDSRLPIHTLFTRSDVVNWP